MGDKITNQMRQHAEAWATMNARALEDRGSGPVTWRVHDELNEDGEAVIDVSCTLPKPLEYVTFDPKVMAAFNDLIADDSAGD